MNHPNLTPIVGPQPLPWPHDPYEMAENAPEEKLSLRGGSWFMSKLKANWTDEERAAESLRRQNEVLASKAKREALKAKTLLGIVALLLTTTLTSVAEYVETRAPSPTVLVGENFINAVAMVESSRNPKAIGDGGKATGEFQLHAAARIDAKRYLGRAGTDRELARAYFQWLQARFVKRYGKQPTYAELYQAYNRGFGNAARDGFDLSKAPATTQRACKRIEGMMNDPK